MTRRNGFGILLLLFCISFTVPVLAQDGNDMEIDSLEESIIPVKKKFYWSSSHDAALFSTASVVKYDRGRLGILRFSYFANFGFNFNYDPGSNIGLFTGIGIKNIGFIDKVADTTIKRRVYVLGAPLGIKIGNLARKRYIMLGGGMDLPFNYKEKRFTKRNNKQKFNEWFSKRNTSVMPYVFIGSCFSPGITLKLQYYPINFINTSYSETMVINGQSITIAPYAASNYTVNLILLSFGMDIHYRRYTKPKYSTNSSIAKL